MSIKQEHQSQSVGASLDGDLTDRQLFSKILDTIGEQIRVSTRLITLLEILLNPDAPESTEKNLTDLKPVRGTTSWKDAKQSLERISRKKDDQRIYWEEQAEKARKELINEEQQHDEESGSDVASADQEEKESTI